MDAITILKIPGYFLIFEFSDKNLLYLALRRNHSLIKYHDQDQFSFNQALTSTVPITSSISLRVNNRT